jgi:hypothetical protein
LIDDHCEVMDAPDWPALRHAYGSAGDIPALLERARHAAAPADYQDEPWFSLWSALCHQGDVYTASYAAVPPLIAIAEERAGEPAVVHECLLLAGLIELERALPEGQTPPAIPNELASPYTSALERGAELAAKLLSELADPEMRQSLAISHCALRGDVHEARLLADGPDGQDEE